MAFLVVDLISQELAIEKELAGKSNAEIINWLEYKGKVHKLKKKSLQERQLFRFHSYFDIKATFFLDRGKFIFIGGHSTFRPREVLP